ncbi:unnamed protein product [Somion occarium]|uniref:Uncharacterized protein n=1 Tax=Somion occarium TaxID=3059160 RepID=A0ABP1D5K6_9APHY
MSGYSRQQALNVATSSPFTRDLRHVKAVIPRFWNNKGAWADGGVNAVMTKERIKWWNIVPGDRVRVLGDPESTIHEVSQINRLSNRVYLKSRSASEDTENVRPPRDKNVHYARCQLHIGNQEFPARKGETKSKTLDVFATRLSTTAPRWIPSEHRFHWKRFAVATFPRLPEYSKDNRPRTHIKWPKPLKQRLSDATPYETPLSVVNEITYTLPPLPSDVTAPLPAPPSEHEYIKTISKSDDYTFNASLPIEVHVHKELTNPHSRAKKQERWQAYQMYRRSLLHQVIQAEYKSLRGRTRREARAEATFKWRQQLIDERKAEAKRRWCNRGQEAKLTSKNERKARKADRLDKKLRDLVIPTAPNQVIPGKQARL